MEEEEEDDTEWREGGDEIEKRGQSRDRDQERRSDHFIFIFPSFHRVSRHSTWMRCQNLALQPDGTDQSGK